MSLGNWLQSQLKKRGWSQGELSRRSGLSQPQISGLIAGSKDPSAEACRKLANVFEVTPETVMRLAGLLPSSADDDEVAEAIELLRAMPTEKRSLATRLVRMIYRDSDS